MPLSSIVVATDFSKGAQHALGRAMQLPLKRGAHVVLVHALPDDIPGTLMKKAQAEAQQALTQELSRAQPRPGVTLEGVVVLGSTADQLCKQADAHEADLIVMGRHGRKGLEGLILGSTPFKVTRRSNRPVLVVNRAPEDGYHRAFAAVELDSQAKQVAKVARTVVGDAPTLRLFHAAPVPFEDYVALAGPKQTRYREKAKAEAFKALSAIAKGVDAEPEVRLGDARSLILEEVEHTNADLVTVGTHGRSTIGRLLEGSLSEWVVGHLTCDVLVVRNPERPKR